MTRSELYDFSQLKRHLKMHDGYKCEKEGCSYKAEKFSQLVKHRREKHKRKANCEQPVNCPYCQKRITTASGL